MIRNILEILEKTADRLPDKVSFYDDREKLTYAQLVHVSKAIGTALARVAPHRTPVASLMDGRSIKNVSAFLGIVYAGCANAPFDITMPTERLQLLLDLLNPSAILADDKGRAALEGIHIDAPVISYEDASATDVDEAVIRQIRSAATVMDPMSILYTSGSTGIPKGSIQTMLSYIMWNRATVDMYSFKEEWICANQSPFFYANFIFDVFPPITVGATVYVLPAGALTFPKMFINCLREHHVSSLCMTPSSYIAISNAGVVEPGCLPDMVSAYTSGETMPWGPLKTWMDATPNAIWWHFYGSTETFAVAVGTVQGEHQAGERLSVGKPFPMVHLLFVDEDGRQAPPGEPGEMLVSSPWISQGYHRDPARSAASWVIDPLECGWHERFYHSGDMGYLTPEGELMVVGRRDNQLKHFGYRMELADVDRGLQAIPEVKESCVLHEKESGRIFCFYVGSLDEKALNKALKARLQPYMLPDVYVHLDEMPHTASMKVARAALAQMMAEYKE